MLSGRLGKQARGRLFVLTRTPMNLLLTDPHTRAFSERIVSSKINALMCIIPYRKSISRHYFFYEIREKSL
jgi:hypothetical protein